jgi:hypothetical protein
MPPSKNLIIHVIIPSKLLTHAVTIFIGVARDTPNPPYLLVVAQKEEEETNLHYHEPRHEEKTIL